jgi:hypothetical protein
MKKLQNGVYGVTNRAALVAQRMGWPSLYLSTLWLGTAFTRLFFKRQP